MSGDVPCAIEVTRVDGGVDITVTAEDGHLVDAIGQSVEQGGSITLHVRDYDVPRDGSRVMAGGRLVKVCDRRYGQGGRLWLLDEDTRVWHDAEKS